MSGSTTNPMIAQGTLNRVRAAIQWATYPQLNITASYLGRGGITFATNGQATTAIPTMTGMVMSPEPYQPVMMTANLLRSQSLANSFEAQRQLLSVLGDCQVIPDATPLASYNVFNSAIQNVRELPFTGDDAGYVVEFSAYLPINSSLWSLT